MAQSLRPAVADAAPARVIVKYRADLGLAGLALAAKALILLAISQ
jgi:hypothetical protein